MFGWLKRRRRSRQHPTPRQAYEALSEGLCLYAGMTKCSGSVRAVGLRNELDGSDVLVCRAHYGGLWQLDERSAEQLERVLTKAFARPARG